MKYVFFLDTNSAASGSQVILLDLAVYLADNTDNEVYYVNNYFDEDHTRHAETKLNFETIDTFDFSAENDVIYFTPVNYLLHLLSRIKDCLQAKICLYVYDPQATSWLISHIGDRRCASDLNKMLRESGACAYLNYKCVTPQNPYNFYDDYTFIPIALKDYKEETVPVEETVNSDTINIGYYGSLYDGAVQMIKNLLRNLVMARLDKNIDIHVIGHVNSFLDFRTEKAPGCTTRIIYTGYLDEEERAKYLRKNVDVVLSAGDHAIEAASFGVPVMIPVFSKNYFTGNNYVYIHDVNGYVYSWDNGGLLASNNTTYKIDQVIDQIYNKKQKARLAKRSLQYIRENNSLKAIGDKFISYADNSTLTVRDCLLIKEIVAVLDNFEEYKTDNGECDFSTYLANRKK